MFLYSNAKEVHSDRVHACVAALAYGIPARFYYDTPRAGLFDKVLKEDISKKVTTIDQDKIRREKERQILALREAVDEMIWR